MTRRHFPAFSVAWLTTTSLLYLLLMDARGAIPARVVHALALVPADVAGAPWRLLLAPASVVLASDAVQFAYVTALVALFVPAFEWREGWRRTASVFFGAGLGSVLLVTTLVFLPLAVAFPGSEVVTYSVTRPYVGASTAAFAVAGALAGRLERVAHRWGLVSGVAAWEFAVWAAYFRFSELIVLYHAAAIALGFAVVRTRWFARIR